MKPRILLQHIPLYSVLRRFRCKKDIPKNLGFPVLVTFGLWGKWYIVKGFGGLVTTSGEGMPFHEMYLPSGEVVIGRRDMTAAEGRPYAEQWRQSAGAAMLERAGLQP